MSKRNKIGDGNPPQHPNMWGNPKRTAHMGMAEPEGNEGKAGGGNAEPRT